MSFADLLGSLEARTVMTVGLVVDMHSSRSLKVNLGIFSSCVMQSGTVQQDTLRTGSHLASVCRPREQGHAGHAYILSERDHESTLLL